MVRLNFLDPFETYRTKPPMIMPEIKNSRKKYEAYMVIAPSIEEELQFLSQNQNLKFNNLYKYYIDKRWDITVYGQGRKVYKINEDGTITAMLERYTKGNLSKIDGVTSFLSSNKARVLKDLNVLIETGHITQTIVTNPKDRRLMSYRAKQCIEEYYRLYNAAQAESPTNYLGKYKVEIIIPMDLWVSAADMKNPVLLFKANGKNFIGQVLLLLADPRILQRFSNATFYITYQNLVLPIRYNDIPADSKPEFIMSCLEEFMRKARNLHNPVPDTDGVIEDSGKEKLAKAQKKTETEAKVDKVLEDSKLDPDTVDDKTREVIQKVTENTPDPENSVVTDRSDVDVLLAAKSEGKSVASYKRDQLLKEKYSTLKIGNVPLKDIIKEEELYQIPDMPVYADVIEQELKDIKSSNFEKSYNDNLALRDMTNILLHFSHVSPALYLNKDIKVEDASTPTDRLIRYTVEYESEDRKRHRFSFLMPKMYKDKYFYLNDQEMNLIHQKLPYPVTKVSPNKCQAVTNYNKIFTERYGQNFSPRITKIKKLFAGPGCPRFAKSDKGDSTKLNTFYLTSIEYDEIGSVMTKLGFAKNTSDTLRIYLVVDDAKAVIPAPKIELEDKDEQTYLLPLAVRNVNKVKTFYYISGTTNRVYDHKGTSMGELSDFIITAAGWYDDKITDEFSEISAGSKFVYSRSKIMDEWIPTIIMLGAADPGGLIAVLEKAKIKYQFTDKRPTVDKDVQGVVPFKDGWLVYNRYPYENSLLLNGLSTFPTKEYSFYDMGTRDTYVEIFDLMFGRRNLIDAMQNFYYMFIDPITYDVCLRLKLPTEFTRLILYCNGVLADNTYQLDSDYHNTRLRSNEVVYAYLYKALADAWGAYRSGRAPKFSIPEDAIIKTILTANIVDPHSELNMILEAENDRQVKLKGPSGMNEDRSFTLEKRAYHPSMMGIIGMNSTASGEVGINRHMTLNSNIVDARGFINVEKQPFDKYDGTELLTPGEMMQTFGPESSDIERLAMSISQSKHEVPVASETSSIVTYDMERVMPYLSNDYAFTAKKDGKVVAIENDIMIIQYADGTYDDVDLSVRPARNTDGGFYIMNQLSTDLKVGAKVKAGQLVAIDTKYINDHDMFGDPTASMGTMARVAIVTDGSVFEDACYMTDDLAHRMATKITRQKRVILSKYANINYIAKVNQAVQANDPILTFDDTQDEFTSQMLANMAAEANDDDEILATSAPVVTKYTGTITDIRIYYTVPLEELTPSLRKIVETYNKSAEKREKTLNKFMGTTNSNTIVKTSQQLEPDYEGKIKGAKVGDGVIIDFYIEYVDVIAPGDKISYFSPLKGIVSDMIPTELAAYAESNPDRKIDAYLSGIGVYKRMSLDCIKVGTLTKILIEKKRLLKEKYGQRIKAESKKK